MPTLSVLDLAPIPEGATAAGALRNTLDLARHAEAWGFRRFWLAEHHNMPGIASAATAVLIGRVAAATQTIRVGADQLPPGETRWWVGANQPGRDILGVTPKPVDQDDDTTFDGQTVTPRAQAAVQIEHGVDKRGVLRQHYDTDALDASTLLAAIFGFLPPDDKRLRASVLAIADELTEHGFVLRYRTGETDDGLSGKEGTFLICSFWLVSALAIIGEDQRARDLMEKLLRVASPLGLFAEEFDVDTGRHLGNFPQAFSHLALIEAAARIILVDRLEELSL